MPIETIIKAGVFGVVEDGLGLMKRLDRATTRERLFGYEPASRLETQVER